MNCSLRSILLGLTLAGFAGIAAAHPDHGTASFTNGLVHPLQGFDHLLAMLAVGLWSATASRAGSRRVAAPALFVALMLVGAAAGKIGGAAPLVEPAIAASVVLLGALVFAGRRLDPHLGWAAIGAAAVVHGYAHGVEAAGAAVGAFVTGFVLATVLLQAASVAIGVYLDRGRAWIVRATALLVGASGVAMFAARL